MVDPSLSSPPPDPPTSRRRWSLQEYLLLLLWCIGLSGVVVLAFHLLG